MSLGHEHRRPRRPLRLAIARLMVSFGATCLSRRPSPVLRFFGDPRARPFDPHERSVGTTPDRNAFSYPGLVSF